MIGPRTWVVRRIHPHATIPDRWVGRVVVRWNDQNPPEILTPAFRVIFDQVDPPTESEVLDVALNDLEILAAVEEYEHSWFFAHNPFNHIVEDLNFRLNEAMEILVYDIATIILANPTISWSDAREALIIIHDPTGDGDTSLFNSWRLRNFWFDHFGVNNWNQFVALVLDWGGPGDPRSRLVSPRVSRSGWTRNG